MLLDELERLFVAEGFAHLSVADLAARLRVSRSTLYRLATGKQVLAELVISRVETVREDYRLRFQRHRDGLTAIARAVGWSLGFHRTDRPPHLALLALHAALTADRRR